MRITTRSLSALILSDIQAAGQRVLGYQEHLATGKRINRPSDDAAGTSMVLNYKSRIASIDQFQRNVGLALDRLASTESVLTQASDVFSRAYALAQKGANDSTTGDARVSLALEVNQLLEELVAQGNSRADGRYLFAGTADDQPAYSVSRDAQGRITAVTPSAYADVSVLRQVNDGETLQVNLTASEVFGTSGSGENLFQLLMDLRDRLEANDGEGVRTLTGEFPKAIDQVTANLAVVGVRSNRLTELKDRLAADRTQNQAAQSRVEDADVTETAVKLQEAQTALTGALQVSGKILRMSLLDYM
jgi:flagellar hook-associated protein 3 FlgL